MMPRRLLAARAATSLVRPALVLTALVTAALLAPTRTARAQGGLILLDAPPHQAYHLSIGPTLLAFARDPGASQMQTLLIPGLDFYTRQGLFVSTDNGVGWNLSQRDDLQWGVRLWPQLGRARGALGHPGLAGVGDRLQKGLFANFAPLRYVLLQSSLLAGAGQGGDGVVGEIGATVGLPFGQPDNTFGLSVGATWANGPYRQSYFGITPAMAQASGLPAWHVGGGWQDLNVGLVGEVPLNRRWTLSGQLSSARLLGAAAASPITQSRDQSTLSLTLWYSIR